MRNPFLSRQRPAGPRRNPAINPEDNRQPLKSFWTLALLLLALCSVGWAQQPEESTGIPQPQAPTEITTASATAAPLLIVPQPPLPVLARPSVERDAKQLKPEDNVELIGRRNVGGGVNFYSLQKEQALGRQLADQVESQSRLIKDPVIEDYINGLGQEIVRHSDAKVPFTIKVIDDSEVNAFALPGGFFYVDSGLILAADSESELAGVMAHEIAHVAARHATRNATRAQIFNLVSIPLIFVGGPVGYAVREIAGLAVPMSFLKFSRDAEREADLLGLQYDYASGYDPQAFVRFFEKLKAGEKQHRGWVAKAFATHPMTGDRIRRAQREIAGILPPKSEYIEDTSEFHEIKTRLAHDVEATRPDSGGRPRLIRRDRKEKDKNDGGPVLRKKQ